MQHSSIPLGFMEATADRQTSRAPVASDQFMPSFPENGSPDQDVTVADELAHLLDSAA